MAVDPLIELRDVNKHFGLRSAAHRVVFMADGRIVEDRTPDEFFTNRSSDRARDFLSKILTH